MINLNKIPSSPGCYLYRNSDKEIIYIGKAVNLKKRVSQYFTSSNAIGPKTSSLVSQIKSVETRVVNSEIEALILEASLIKKYRPKFNSLLKDDRSYLYICITKEKYPRVFSTHLSNLPTKADIFGPFPNGSAVNSLLKTIRRIFPFYSQKKHPSKPCLYCHLNLCPGPNPDQSIYKHNIGKLKKLLKGNFKLLTRQLISEMKQASKKENYELALELRRQIDSINYIVSGWRSLSSLFENINVPEDRSSQAIDELKTTLKIKAINRIECFDISQIGSIYFVGSMTVWQNGHLDHQAYRQFKINSKITPDDQYMIKEVIFRRLQHPEWGIPDLIMVDGGKPQVSAAMSLLTSDKFGFNMLIVGLAKKFETLILKESSNWIEINLPSNSSGLNLLKSLRDEAHRFANRYRKSLIKKSLIQ